MKGLWTRPARFSKRRKRTCKSHSKSFSSHDMFYQNPISYNGNIAGYPGNRQKEARQLFLLRVFPPVRKME